MSAEQDVKLDSFSDIFRLDGRVAVVTGGSRGLGLHVASGFLQAGCSRVYITSRKADACASAVKALNALPNIKGKAISIPADASKISEIERLVSEVSKTTDKVDILFANAGATWGAPFEATPENSFTKVLDLNVKSVFYTAQKFAPLLEKAGKIGDPSRIIITASVAGIGLGTLGKNATFSYSASKAAAISLTKNLAVELAPRGVTVNAVAPGFYPSKMASGLLEMQGGAQKMADDTPDKRLGEPEDIAGLVVFLASRASKHINGDVITTDGGAILAKGKL
jgi:NAD(P)-dependent dehydrogenase (short-subunit alcohol dehydrogenase family)